MLIVSVLVGNSIPALVLATKYWLVGIVVKRFLLDFPGWGELRLLSGVPFGFNPGSKVSKGEPLEWQHVSPATKLEVPTFGSPLLVGKRRPKFSFP